VLPDSLRFRKPWLRADEASSREKLGSTSAISIGAFREFMKVVSTERSLVRSIKVPVLAVFSELDQRTHISSAEILRQEAPSNLVTIVNVKDSGHHVLIGQQQGEVLLAIDSFIQRVA
jgi:esterase/lipase